MITKFIASLSNIGKILLIVAVVASAIMLFDRLLLSPTLSKMAVIDGQIEEETTGIKQDLHFLSYKDRILRENKLYDPYLTAKLPADSEINEAFLKKIDEFKAKANVTVNKVTQATGAKEKEYYKYKTDLECTGTLADVITFMHLINNSPDMMKVVKFNFTNKKADTDELKATMTIHKIIVTKT